MQAVVTTTARPVTTIAIEAEICRLRQRGARCRLLAAVLPSIRTARQLGQLAWPRSGAASQVIGQGSIGMMTGLPASKNEKCGGPFGGGAAASSRESDLPRFPGSRGRNVELANLRIVNFRQPSNQSIFGVHCAECVNHSGSGSTCKHVSAIRAVPSVTANIAGVPIGHTMPKSGRLVI